MILVDTSAWIEFQRRSGSEAHLRLRTAIENSEPLATTGIVLLEMLAGARNDGHADELRRLLAICTFVPAEEPTDSEVAAGLYRTCRRSGRTIRRLPDCLIAAIAIRSDAAVLHADADFTTLAALTPLRTLGPSKS